MSVCFANMSGVLNWYLHGRTRQYRWSQRTPNYNLFSGAIRSSCHDSWVLLPLLVIKRDSCWGGNFVCEPYYGEDERNPRINLPRKLATSGTCTGIRLSTLWDLLSQIHNVAHIKLILII